LIFYRAGWSDLEHAAAGYSDASSVVPSVASDKELSGLRPHRREQPAKVLVRRVPARQPDDPYGARIDAERHRHPGREARSELRVDPELHAAMIG